MGFRSRYSTAEGKGIEMALGRGQLVAVAESPGPGQPPTLCVPSGWSHFPSLSFLICKVESLLTTSPYQGQECKGAQQHPLLICGTVTVIQDQSLRKEDFLPGLHVGGTSSQRHLQTYRDSS